ncbi:MAG TPA: RNA polymerase sigma factor [Candidatus Dormibacteraeota bacterium]|jgi:RNA polymerase sigma-70 factor (ECF subfamily)|nr:RNA polymerase sigma factor [Candidatus Dormibacteraeota bacterium]
MSPIESDAPLDLAGVRLWRAVAAGEPEAVRELIDQHLPIVYGFILGRLAGRAEVAEEVLQETLFAGLRGQRSFRGDAALATWLCAIARSKLHRHWEVERRAELAVSGLRELSPDRDLEEEVGRRDMVLQGLAALTPLHRQVLVMKYMDDLSVEAIAARLSRSAVQVQSLLQRARDAFRRVVPDA